VHHDSPGNAGTGSSNTSSGESNLPLSTETTAAAAPSAEEQICRVFIETEDGKWVEIETGLVLTEEDETVVGLPPGFTVADYNAGCRIAKLIQAQQDECNNIAKVAAMAINDRLRRINGLFYRFGIPLKQLFKPMLKGDKKNVKFPEHGFVVSFRKTGGLECADKAGLNSYIKSLTKEQVEKLGGTFEPKLSMDQIRAAVAAGNQELKQFFRETKVDELGIMKIGSNAYGWSPRQIGTNFKTIKQIPMLRAESADDEEAAS
jgi:hypothetical protein